MVSGTHHDVRTPPRSTPPPNFFNPPSSEFRRPSWCMMHGVSNTQPIVSGVRSDVTNTHTAVSDVHHSKSKSRRARMVKIRWQGPLILLLEYPDSVPLLPNVQSPGHPCWQFPRWTSFHTGEGRHCFEAHGARLLDWTMTRHIKTVTISNIIIHWFPVPTSSARC